MPVLIDGNNLLFAARQVEGVGLEIGRSNLCDRLGLWSQRRNVAVHVVFDGPAPPPALAAQIGHPHLRVTYSGAGRSADSVLERLLAIDSAARRLVVVSSDRAVMRAAKRRLARPLRSDEFWRQVQRDLVPRPPRPTEPTEKRTGLTPEATDDWLREFGFD